MLGTFYRHQFKQRIDHFNTHKDEYFNQTFLTDFDINKTQSKPILIILGGFNPISEDMAKSDVIKKLRNATDARIVILEHRFFGSSFPESGFTNESRLSLMIHQSLADIDHFLEISERNFCGNECKIGLIGSQYAGSLATWSRVRYPHLTTGSLALSAPVLMTPEFPYFDEFYSEKLNNYGSKCLESTKNVFNQIESILERGDNSSIELKEKFDFSPDQDDVSLLHAISEVLSIPLSEENSLIYDHCKSISSNQSIETFSETYHKILNEYNFTSDYFDPFEYSKYPNLYSRLWIQCNQVGWFRTSSGPNGLRSSKVNLSYFNRVCQNAFDINVSDSSISNIDFGGTNPYLSNAIFINREEDPYTNLSVQESVDYMGRYTIKISGAAASSDLYPINKNTHYKIGDETNSNSQKIQDSVNYMKRWILDECNKYCTHGTCILSQCVCNKMWDGEYCNQNTHTLYAYKIVSAVCVLGPTIILLFFGMFVLICGTKEDSEIDHSRKSYFT